MTWSLGLQNGDLTLGGASLGTVTSSQKLVQDLRAYILEQIGTDSMHPEYGSTLNGGRLADGTSVHGVIGEVNDALAQAEIETELRRIINNYQSQQLQRAKDDKLTYGKTTFTRGEILLGVTAFNFTQRADQLDIHITLQTASDTNPDLTLTLT